jgi:phage tail sheath protein FI
MPEYLAPGVFVEETSFRQKTIEGVSTSTTGFVGPARFGPTRGEPEILTSFTEFERIYGGIDALSLGGGTQRQTNYLAQAVRAYFEEGGKRLYVARVFNSVSDDDDGVASWQPGGASPPEYEFRARYPGAAGNMAVTLLFKRGPNVRRVVDGSATLSGVRDAQVVLVDLGGGSPRQLELYAVTSRLEGGMRRFGLENPDLSPSGPDLDSVTAVYPLTVTVTAQGSGRFDQEQAWEDLALDPGQAGSLSAVLALEPQRRATALYVPLVFDPQDLDTGLEIASALLSGDGADILQALDDDEATDADRSLHFELEGGNDGSPLLTADYQGREDTDGTKSGLVAFEDLEDISILAAPGSTATEILNAESVGRGVIGALITHCERMRYRIAVLDSLRGQLPSEIRELRGGIDSTRAALYYPWVRISNPLADGPLAPSEILLPPSGFVAGIYARNDVERGVHKAPANEVVRLALGFELLINKAQQEVLNPLGVNCLRFFEGRGHRVWGARTTSSDPEWKYVNVRRYFAFLERSIEKGTQFAVFEPNGPELWENIRLTVSDFLFNEYTSNHLLGSKPEQAYFVRCDRTTMTQNDIDNGRLICLVGVSPLRPAEFVIFRIGQKTADARS